MPHPCLNCEAAIMAQATKDVVIKRGAVRKTVAAIYGWHCPNCGEIEFLDEDGSTRFQAALEQASAENRLAQANFIRQTRKKLHLTQPMAAAIFGGGHSSFSEYEHGKTRPPKSMLLLFKLLNKHPEMLQELLEQNGHDAWAL